MYRVRVLLILHRGCGCSKGLHNFLEKHPDGETLVDVDSIVGNVIKRKMVN
jgi:hypothetical protein